MTNKQWNLITECKSIRDAELKEILANIDSILNDFDNEEDISEKIDLRYQFVLLHKKIQEMLNS